MSLSTLLYTWVFGKFVKKYKINVLIGHKRKNLSNIDFKRWVIFNGKIEATKVPPHWHAWLHKTIEDPPLNYSHKYFWQKNHEENLTGTEKAYYPDEHPLSKANNKVKKSEYESWSP